MVVLAPLALCTVCKSHERCSDLAITTTALGLMELTWLVVNVSICDRYFAVLVVRRVAGVGLGNCAVCG